MPEIVAEIIRNDRIESRHRGYIAVAIANGSLLDSVASRSADSSDSPITGTGELAIDQKSFDDQVLAALHTLEDTARACLLLRTVEGMPYREISVALDIPEGTAMSHVHRSRQSMRRILSLAQIRDGSHVPGGGA